MEKFIPYEKLSKKEQKKRNAARRNTWGELNPVTRKPQNSRAYNRRKALRCTAGELTAGSGCSWHGAYSGIPDNKTDPF